MESQKLQSSQLFGLGLRQPHHAYILKNKPKIDFFEIHSENFIAKGGGSLNFLEKISEIYTLSFHSIGLSIGSQVGIEEQHLKDIKFLIDKFNPFLISDHLSWSSASEYTSNDLLPIVYNNKSLEVFVNNIKKVQDFLGRNILIENPTAYIEFNDSLMSEVDFLNKLTEKSGCDLLLDINNIFVTSKNFNLNPISYLDNINSDRIKEVHLAGHEVCQIDNKEFRIDTHGREICQEVLDLYRYFIKKYQINAPTLVEWDTDIPEFNILEQELSRIKYDHL